MDGENATGVLPVARSDDPVERLEALFDAHYDRLYRLARRLVSNGDDARDLVQDTFLKAARSPNSIPQGMRDEEAWLVRVLINVRRDQWRRMAVRNRARNEVPTRPHPETAMIARAVVWAALDVLPPRRRAVVVMYELEGADIPSIASLLGISAITVRWHLSMGRRALSKALHPYTGETNGH